MQTKLKEMVNGHPVLEKMISKITLRAIVQLFIVAVLLLAAWQFYWYVDFLKTGAGDPVRPAVAEGFLPIAAIVAFKAMFATGQIDSIHPAGLVIFIAFLVTAWLFRRATCSWICPIGTLSEYLAKLGQKLFGKNFSPPKWLDIALLCLKYGLFFYLVRFLFMMSSQDAVGFMQLPYYSISDVKMFEMYQTIGAIGFTVIAVLLIGSVLIKSFWCRYLCPYGALLGILGFFSPIVLVKDNDKCINCSRCNKACPNKVDVQKAKKVVLTGECTGCTECVKACPVEGTLRFKFLGLIKIKPIQFSLLFLIVFFGIIVWAKATGNWNSALSNADFQNLYQSMSGFSSGQF